MWVENILRNKHLNLPEHFKALEHVPYILQSFKTSSCRYLMCTHQILDNILGLQEYSRYLYYVMQIECSWTYSPVSKEQLCPVNVMGLHQRIGGGTTRALVVETSFIVLCCCLAPLSQEILSKTTVFFTACTASRMYLKVHLRNFLALRKTSCAVAC